MWSFLYWFAGSWNMLSKHRDDATVWEGCAASKRSDEQCFHEWCGFVLLLWSVFVPPTLSVWRCFLLPLFCFRHCVVLTYCVDVCMWEEAPPLQRGERHHFSEEKRHHITEDLGWSPPHHEEENHHAREEAVTIRQFHLVPYHSRRERENWAFFFWCSLHLF